MQEMESPEQEQTRQEDIAAPEYTYYKNEQSTRSFFAVLSFLLAAVCLFLFLTRPLDNITGLVVLFAVLTFAIGGIILLERNPYQAQKPNPNSSLSSQIGDDHQTVIIDSTIVDSDDQEDTDNAEDIEDIDYPDEEDIEDAEDTGYTEDTDEEAHTPFEMLVEDALSSIPFEFQEKMANLVVMVEDEPDEETLERVGMREGHILLGLYQGVPLTAQGHAGAILPERIIIYQRTIEDYCHGDPERIRNQVRSTLLHEVAHHFGMDHEEMPIWVR